MSPPETGASIDLTPNFSASYVIFMARLGVDVVWSIRKAPFFMCFRIPDSGLSKISSTSWGYPNIKNKKSDSSAISFGDLKVQPLFIKSYALD